MPLARTKKTVAFDHVLNVVFGVLKDDPLYKALEKSGDTDIRDIISLDKTDIGSLTYDKSATEKIFPSPGVTRHSFTSLSATSFTAT